MPGLSFLSLFVLLGCSARGGAEGLEVGDTASLPDSDEGFETSPESEGGDVRDGEHGNESTNGDESGVDEACPPSWVLTYALSGQVDITHTPLNIGNATAAVGGLASDELVIRVADDGGVPADGRVVITDFNLLQDFRVSVNLLGEIAIVTHLLSTAAEECGVATGERIGTVMDWDECNEGLEHGTNEWSPDEGASGAGCVNDYRVEGEVDCVDDSALASCEDGWLNDGMNTLDYVYNQPMLSLKFDSNEWERFTMQGREYGAELPTYTNNRTWLSLQGELKSMVLEPTPVCLCEQ